MVKNAYDIIIIGGGPAGSAAGIALSRKGFSTLIIEKQHSMDDKICGEFFSPEWISYVTELDLQDEIFMHRPATIKKVGISFNGSSSSTLLENPALGLSREKADTSLLNTAVKRGVNVLRGFEAIDQQFSGNDARVTIRNRKTNLTEEFAARYIVSAAGAKSGSELKYVESKKKNAYSAAFKFHAECTPVDNAVELYFTSYGYIGIGTIENGKVNVCGLIDSDLLKRNNGDVNNIMKETSSLDKKLGKRYGAMEIISPPVVCSNLSFGKRKPKHKEIVCIGDTAGSIHPFCGDGNAMALKSGIMCSELIEEALQKKWSPAYAAHTYRKRWNREFGSRIAISSFVYRSITSRFTQPAVSRLSKVFPGVINKVFTLTRETKK